MAQSKTDGIHNYFSKNAVAINQEDLTADALMSSEYNIPLTFTEKRHIEKIIGTQKPSGAWRMKERMKTVSVALVLCLNVGVDPPDVLKIQPCAREECWIDPLATGPKKALEAIGCQLQKQYERWQPRARSKLSLDPTLEEVKKLCQSLRRNAKEERVLFHYNGHGVPKPTENGEIWVFNKNYTQYIPLSLYTLQSWMSMPSIYVFDCSNAGLILDKFTEFQQTREPKIEEGGLSGSTTSSGSEVCRQCILLGACSSIELLPQDPNLPADLFTSCLTTPIAMALRWYVLQTSGKLVKGITKELIDNIPGALNDRRTMLGELNWIFTAITDTIAWNVLPRETFQKLFRQDLLVASLFRNFLLAERIMKSYNCTPVSNQRLPSTYQHPMWQAWDFTLDACLSQLPAISKKQAEFQYSTFFAEQLTAFQVWLEYKGINTNPPEQLPIVLQVLLSQVHRLRALDLLSRFLDHGPNAVSLALSVGIFPYVLKLLQSSARELRPLLVFIWAKILSVDGSCQVDLVKDGGHKYFLHVLDDRDMPSEYRTMAAFVLAMIVNHHTAGQEAVYQGKAISICLLLLDYKHDHRLRAWCALCLGVLWQNFPVAKWAGVRDNAHEKVGNLLEDSVPEVRCAALLALFTFINQPDNRTEHAINLNNTIGIQICGMTNDPSPMVREELLSGIAGFVAIYETQFISLAQQMLEDEALSNQLAGSPQKMNNSRNVSVDRLKSVTGSPYTRDGYMSQASSNGVYGSSDSLDASSPNCSSPSAPSYFSYSANASTIKRVASSNASLGIVNVYNTMWRTLLQLAVDPFHSVNQLAGIIINLLKNKASASSGLRSANISISSPERNNTSSASSHSTARNMTASETTSVDKMVDTEFFQWSCKMFEKSVMTEFCNKKSTNADLEHEKQNMYADNVKVKVKALQEHLQAPYTPIETEVFANKMNTLPSILRFHPYDIRLAVADNDSISLWDWEAGVKLNRFYNHSSKTCKITGMEYLNPQEAEKSLLAIATDDGSVRIWRDFSSKYSQLELVTAWQAIPDTSFIKMTTNSPGMVMEWQQNSTSLFFSGACKFIRLYDTNSELKVMDLPTGSDGCVTSLLNDSQNISLVMASCSDGSVRIFDTRQAPSSSRICSFKHSSWVINCQTLKGDGNTVVSACRGGEVKFWDLRNRECIGGLSVGSGLRSMTIHKQAELIACGVSEQMISIYNTAGDATSYIKYHEGFMGQRVAKVSCLSFHPHLVRLASGNVDGMVSVFMMSDKSK